MKLVIFIYALLLLNSCSNQHSENISGNWQWKLNDSIKDFSLDLKQIGNELEGSYCGIYDAGSRIDCPKDSQSNIIGNFKSGKWEIDYVSNYSGKKGKAIITYNKEQNTLVWKDLTTSNGSFCPKNAILIK